MKVNISQLMLTKGSPIEKGRMDGDVHYEAYKNGLVIVSGSGVLEFNLRDCQFHYDHKMESFYTVIADGNFHKVGYRAFLDWFSLGTVILPKSIQTIEAGAFSDCDCLTEILLPGHINYIGKDAFAYNGLETIICYDDIPVCSYLRDYFKKQDICVQWRGKKL